MTTHVDLSRYCATCYGPTHTECGLVPGCPCCATARVGDGSDDALTLTVRDPRSTEWEWSNLPVGWYARLVEMFGPPDADPDAADGCVIEHPTSVAHYLCVVCGAPARGYLLGDVSLFAGDAHAGVIARVCEAHEGDEYDDVIRAPFQTTNSHLTPDGWADTATGRILTFDECQARGLDGTGRDQ